MKFSPYLNHLPFYFSNVGTTGKAKTTSSTVIHYHGGNFLFVIFLILYLGWNDKLISCFSEYSRYHSFMLILTAIQKNIIVDISFQKNLNTYFKSNQLMLISVLQARSIIMSYGEVKPTVTILKEISNDFLDGFQHNNKYSWWKDEIFVICFDASRIVEIDILIQFLFIVFLTATGQWISERYENALDTMVSYRLKAA